MLVLRVEDKEGFGPWMGRGPHRAKLNSDHFYSSLCPDVCVDVPRFTYNLSCGFDSLEMYKEWFDKECRVAFEKAEYNVKIFKINKRSVKFGKRQIAFDKKKAKELQTFSANNISKISNYLKENA